MLISVRCDSCAETEGLFVQTRPEKLPDCPRCGGPRHRQRVDPSLTTRDRIDNGMMPKAVERPSEIARLVENREPKNPVW